MLWLRNYGLKTSFGLLTLLLVCAQLPVGLFASSEGTLTFSTPFDHKVYSTGIFDGHNQSTMVFENRNLEQIFNTCRTFRYVSDGKADRWQSAEETEARHAGDCEDKAIWLFSRLKMNGYSNIRLVIGKYRAIDRQYHVWVTYEDGSGNGYLLDPAKQKRVWTIGQFSSGLYLPIFSFDGTNRYRHTT